jgi:hypothetical protein
MNARTKRIWHGLANYANANDKSIDIRELRKAIADCMPWYVATEWLGFLSEHDELFLEKAVKYQPSVRALFRWLINAKPMQRGESFNQAYGFLQEHIGHIKWRLIEVDYPRNVMPELKELGYAPEDFYGLEEQSKKYWEGFRRGESPLGIKTPAKKYEDLADVICDFVATEYQKYREKDYSRAEKRPASPVPVIICPNCDKFVVPDRFGRKKYCSDCTNRARAESYRKKGSPNEARDYAWLYRLRQAEPRLRAARLRQPKNKQRLAEIKARQRNSARCLKLIRKMGLHGFPK